MSVKKDIFSIRNIVTKLPGVNSYAIVNLGLEEEIITIVGYLPFIHVGDTLRVYGKYVEHKEYGKAI